eukprot:TRINITY_DN5846_c0_g1_i2.p1 TRINITY_DN5846_c0_g1~~TRINITY_DN5846_c0_g1_i2.p1  ORF type:complete len:578 (-),score=36.05 TRINITY_DN5846_c0_g1_i2:77-1810(-)
MTLPFTEAISCEEIWNPGSLLWRAHFFASNAKSQRQISPWDDIPVFVSDILATEDFRDLIHCVCKTPAGMWTEVEVAEDEPNHPLRLCRTTTIHGENGESSATETLVHYSDNAPWNICFVPQTATRYLEPTLSPISEETAGPGSTQSGRGGHIRWEPKELLEIGAQSQRKVGEVYVVKPLSAFLVVAGGELSWKIIGIAADDPMAKELNDVKDIKKWLPGCLDQIREWLRRCNCSNGGVGESAFLNDEEAATVNETYVTLLRAHFRWRACLTANSHPLSASSSSQSTTRTTSLTLDSVSQSQHDTSAGSCSPPLTPPKALEKSFPSHRGARNLLPLQNPLESICIDLSSALTVADPRNECPSVSLADHAERPARKSSPRLTKSYSLQGVKDAKHDSSMDRRSGGPTSSAGGIKRTQSLSSLASMLQGHSSSTAMSSQSLCKSPQSPSDKDEKRADDSLGFDHSRGAAVETGHPKVEADLPHTSMAPITTLRLHTLRTNGYLKGLARRRGSGLLRPVFSHSIPNDAPADEVGDHDPASRKFFGYHGNPSDPCSPYENPHKGLGIFTQWNYGNGKAVSR